MKLMLQEIIAKTNRCLSWDDGLGGSITTGSNSATNQIQTDWVHY